jgi:hypothetical protein
MAGKRLHWNGYDHIKAPEIDRFIDEVVEVCRRHGLSISHEDHHGAFEITEISETKIEWLKKCHDSRGSR